MIKSQKSWKINQMYIKKNWNSVRIMLSPPLHTYVKTKVAREGGVDLVHFLNLKVKIQNSSYKKTTNNIYKSYDYSSQF